MSSNTVATWPLNLKSATSPMGRLNTRSASTASAAAFFTSSIGSPALAPLSYKSSGEGRFRESAALHQRVDFLQCLEQLAHARERPRVRAVRKRLGGIRVRLHEDAGNAGRDRGTCEHRHEFALPAGRGSLPAGKLHRMRRIED